MNIISKLLILLAFAIGVASLATVRCRLAYAPLLSLVEQQRRLIEAQKVQIVAYERLISAQATNIAIRERIMEHLETTLK